MLLIDFSIVHYGCPSTISSEKYPEVKSRILHSNILNENEVTVLMHAKCDSIEKLDEFLKYWEGYEKVTKFVLTAVGDNEVVFTISLRNYTEHVTKCILENNGFFTSPIVVTKGEEHWSIVLPDEDAKNKLFTELEEIGKVRIHNISHLDHLDIPIPVEYIDLTTKQANSLKIAYDKGYYDYPKKITSRQIASYMGVSQSTLLEHLRKAENKIIKKIVFHI